MVVPQPCFSSQTSLPSPRFSASLLGLSSRPSLFGPRFSVLDAQPSLFGPASLLGRSASLLGRRSSALLLASQTSCPSPRFLASLHGPRFSVLAFRSTMPSPCFFGPRFTASQLITLPDCDELYRCLYIFSNVFSLIIKGLGLIY